MVTKKSKKRRGLPGEFDEAQLKSSSPCSICGKKMHLTLTGGGVIRGGYYFGNIPLYRKSEEKKMREGGTHKSKVFGTHEIEVYNYDPKPYAHAEMWECDACYKKIRSEPNKPVRLQLRKSKKSQ